MKRVYRSSEAGPARPTSPPAGATGATAAAGGKTGVSKLSKRQRHRKVAGDPPKSKRGAKAIRTAEDVARSVVSGATEKRRAAAKRAGEVHKRKAIAKKDMPRCGANTRKGTPCRHLAGYNTSHEGEGTCYLHGGATPSHEKAAHQAMVGREMAALAPIMESAVPEDLNPVNVLTGYMHSAASKTLWLDAQVRALTTDELVAYRGQTLEHMLGAWSDRGARAAKYLIEAGVPGLLETVQEQQARAFAEVARRALGAMGLQAHERAFGAYFRLEVGRYNAALGADVDLAPLEREWEAAQATVTDADVVDAEANVAGDPDPAPAPEPEVVDVPPVEEPLTVPDDWVSSS